MGKKKLQKKAEKLQNKLNKVQNKLGTNVPGYPNAPGPDQGQQQQLQQQQQQNLMFGDMAKKLAEYAQQNYAQPYSMENLPSAMNADQLAEERKRIEQETYDRFATQMEPQFQQDEERFRARMAAEGVPEGSEKYNKLQKQMQDSQNFQRDQARRGAVEMGGGELSRTYGMSSDARNRAIQEGLLQRDRPYQEMAGLLGLQNYGLSGQYANQAWQSGENALDRSQQWKMFQQTPKGPAADPFALLNAQTQAKKDLMQQQYNLDYQKATQFPQPSSPNPFAQVGSGFAQGIGAGIGQGFFSSAGKPSGWQGLF